MDQIEQDQIKKNLELLSIYEYLFVTIGVYKKTKAQIPSLQPVKIPVFNFNHLSEDRELLEKVVLRFSDIGVLIKIEGTECIIG